MYDAATGMEEELPDDRITFPFADLRSLIPMLRPGQLITVAAGRGTGKPS